MDAELYPEDAFYDPAEEGIVANYLVFDDDGRGYLEAAYDYGNGVYLHAKLLFSYDDVLKQYTTDYDTGEPFMYEVNGTRAAIWNSFTTRSYYEKISDDFTREYLVRSLG